VSGTASVGSVVATAGATANVVGVSAIGQTGQVLVWGRIVPNQNPGYNPETPSQAPAWSAESPTQSPGYNPETPTQTPGWSEDVPSQSPVWTRTAA